MNNSKGITMASLVIIIASVILLSTMAISLGYKYLIETKNADEKYFKEVLSSAVKKRENNYNLNMPEYPKIGYPVTELDSFKNIVNKYVPQISGDSEILFDRGDWYIVDASSAEQLGVKGSSDYIDSYNPDNPGKVRVALVDYTTGTVYIVDIDDVDDIGIGSGDHGTVPPIADHTHDYNIEKATCTLDKKCLICGYVAEVALGHDYGEGFAATPIDEEFHYTKECGRCGMKGGYERHTDLGSYAFHMGEDGKWYHYVGCSKCGWPGADKEYLECETIWKLTSESNPALGHRRECKICKHYEDYPHECEYIYIDQNYHKYVCKVCGYEQERYSPHVDDGTGHCKDCGCEITADNEGPILTKVLLKNKEWPDSHFATDNETIQLIITADRMISNVDATICGYGGSNIVYKYSDDKLTCTAELRIDKDIVIPQNTRVTFTVNCKSVSTGKWMVSPISETSEEDSYLIYDSISPEIEYIYKSSY